MMGRLEISSFGRKASTNSRNSINTSKIYNMPDFNEIQSFADGPILTFSKLNHEVIDTDRSVQMNQSNNVVESLNAEPARETNSRRLKTKTTYFDDGKDEDDPFYLRNLNICHQTNLHQARYIFLNISASQQ
ncbi:hypothetical protein JTB14_025723 [Gonioctena quinquepunctata]|nr:hypothetical protein JTB14_025723 [Gonioctena quinquepunctata]